jgi:hypothetical protein
VNERLVELGRRPLFSVEGVTYSWADVLARTSERGSLEQLRRRTLQGLACQALADGPHHDAVGSAATRFRYARRLLSAEELEAWLERWKLTIDEWGAYLERSWLLERADEPIPLETRPEDSVIDDAEYVDAVCSGFLEYEALDFAAAAALASVAEGGERATSLERIEAAAAMVRASAASEAGIDREVASHRLDWTLLELDLLEVADEGVANEACLCVRVDGRTLADVGEECGVPVQQFSVYLADAEPAFQPVLLAAQPGELVGPVENDGEYALFAIRARTPPRPSDPELRRRAETALIERAVRRAMDGRLEWHEHL